MNIIVDAFGGDNAPLEVIKGAAQAVADFGIEITLTGNEKIIKETAEKNGISLDKKIMTNASPAGRFGTDISRAITRIAVYAFGFCALNFIRDSNSYMTSSITLL